MSQPDGRLLAFMGLLNWAVGLALLLLIILGSGHFVRGIHPLLFLLMPVAGFIWFLRDSPSPQLTKYFSAWRKPWQRSVDVIFQLFPALLPWWVLFRDAVR